MKHKKLFLDLVAAWFSISAMLCAVINLHVSRNMLGKKKHK